MERQRPRSPRDKREGEEPRIVIEHLENADDTDSSSLKPYPIQRRPENPRSCTDPNPAASIQGWIREREAHDRPSSSSAGTSTRNNHHRNRSPYSRSHLRSRSTGNSNLSAPLMTRAHSMPMPYTQQHFATNTTPPSSGSLSPSPLRSPARARSPSKAEEPSLHHPQLRLPVWAETNSSSSSIFGVGTGIEAIQEDAELDITPRAQTHGLSTTTASFSRSNSLRGSRRPASPLHSLTSPIHHPPTEHHPALHHTHSTPASTSASNSPALNPQKYNESYPTSLSLHHYASNSSFSSFSMPSTPTSARSRSPSISSLDTIEDAPEEETVAEAEAIERLRLVADSESDGESEGPRRRSLDTPRASRRVGLGISGERKRWSICGGERRADLDLETIWED